MEKVKYRIIRTETGKYYPQRRLFFRWWYVNYINGKLGIDFSPQSWTKSFSNEDPEIAYNEARNFIADQTDTKEAIEVWRE